jgi:archaeal flagellin FlaB
VGDGTHSNLIVNWEILFSAIKPKKENKMKMEFKNRRGMTGLETAIILVAFVITAAAFSFVVLNMGFLSAQKTQTVISSGMQEAASSLLFDGDMVATCDTTNKNVTAVTFYIRLSQGKEPIDTAPSKMIMTYSCPRAAGVIYSTDAALDGIVSIAQVIGNGDTLVQSGERWKVTIDFAALQTADVLTPAGANCEPQPYETFTVEIRPASGSVLSIARNVGAIYNQLQVLQ